MQTFTLRELADKFGVSIKRIRRWSQAVLPPDPIARKQAGIARKYSLTDAWRLWIIGHCVSVFPVTLAEAGQIFSDLYPWMQARGLTPDDSIFLDLFSVSIYRAESIGTSQNILPAQSFIYKWKKTIQPPHQEGVESSVIVERYQEGFVGKTSRKIVEEGWKLQAETPYILQLHIILGFFRTLMFREPVDKAVLCSIFRIGGSYGREGE